MDSLHTFCKRLPKIELHAHLNGSIREHTLVELAAERNVSLPKKFLLHELEQHDADKEALLFNNKPRSLKDCFDIFAVIPQCVNDLEALKRITKEVLDDAASDNVAYIELRTGPKVLLKDFRSSDEEYSTKEMYIDTIINIMDEFERKDYQRYQTEIENNKAGNQKYIRLPLIPRLLISVDRSVNLAQAMENVQLAIRLSQTSLQGKKYIVGVELGGNPMRNNFKDFLPAFELARKEGLPIAIHCGEVPMGDSNLEVDETKRKAYHEAKYLLEFEPNRLGHALLLSDSLMETLIQQPIPIECCPTSNIMTLELANHTNGSLLDGMKMHPQLGKWIDKKYPISINTDDSGLFCTNLTKELLLVSKAYNLNEIELGNLVLNSIEHIFDSTGDTKSRLRTYIQDQIASMSST